MEKQELIKNFYNNHQEMIDYISMLTDEEFIYSYNGKWTAGQHFYHVYLTICPFPKILSSKEFILKKFGIINRPTWNYDMVIENYFKTSRQSPEQFLPEEVRPEQNASIIADILKIMQTIQQLLENYTEEELDTLVISHPLLGDLTIREIFYLMSYHPMHHIDQAVRNLKHMGDSDPIEKGLMN